jgi:transposase
MISIMSPESRTVGSRTQGGCFSKIFERSILYGMRKRHDKAEKARMAIEAIKGEQTIQEIAIKYGVHPNQVTKWKHQLLEGATSVFNKNGELDHKAGKLEAERDGLLLQIGELTVENTFLKKKYRQLYGSEFK